MVKEGLLLIKWDFRQGGSRVARQDLSKRRTNAISSVSIMNLSHCHLSSYLLLARAGRARTPHGSRPICHSSAQLTCKNPCESAARITSLASS